MQPAQRDRLDILFTVLQLWNLHRLPHTWHHGDLPLRQDKKSDDLVDELQLLNLHGWEHCLDHRHPPLHNDCHVNNIVQELHLWSLSTVKNLFSFVAQRGCPSFRPKNSPGDGGRDFVLLLERPPALSAYCARELSGWSTALCGTTGMSTTLSMNGT